MSNFEAAVKRVLEMEGGFVDNRHDPGGATNFGISLRYLKRLSPEEADVNQDGEVNAKDIVAMTPAKAKVFYRKNWWTKYGYNRIEDADVAIKVLDM